MQKMYVIIILLLFGLGIGLVNEKKENINEIRVRVIPNSNSKEDIKIKNEVKEIVVVFLNDLLKNEEDIDKIKLKIDNNINILRSDLINLYGEEIKVSFCEHQFESKVDDGVIINGGKYLTLLVKINEAKGDNWWGTIYPELFKISSSEKIEYKSFILELIKRG